MRLALLAAALFATVLGAAPSVRAQTAAERQKARELFEAALALADQGRHEQACPLFGQSLRLDPGMGTQYQLAKCYAEIGRLASAHAHFLEVADWAERERRADRAAHARKRAREIEPRIASLRLDVPPEVAATAGLVLTCDGRALRQEQWSTAVPVDLGLHTIAARAPGRQAWSYDVVVTEEGKTVTVHVPMWKPGPTSAAGDHDPQLGAETYMEPGAEPNAPASKEHYPWVIAGLGTLSAATLTAGAVLIGVGSSKQDEAERQTQDGSCSKCEAYGEADDAYNAGGWLLLTGGLFAAGTVAYAVLDAPASEDSGGNVSAQTWMPMVGPDAVGLSWMIAF